MSHFIVSDIVVTRWVDTRSVDIFPLCALSFTTRNLILMCFDLDELLLLLEYRTTNLLSQSNFSGLSMFPNMHSLVAKFCHHIP